VSIVSTNVQRTQKDEKTLRGTFYEMMKAGSVSDKAPPSGGGMKKSRGEGTVMIPESNGNQEEVPFLRSVDYAKWGQKPQTFPPKRGTAKRRNRFKK